MNTKRKPRIAIPERYDKKKKRQYFEKRRYSLALNKTEIGILKAALHYYLLADDYGHCIWFTNGGSIGRSDYRYQSIICGTPSINGLLGVLNRLSNIKPDYGYWFDSERMTMVLSDVFKDQEKKADEFEDKYGLRPMMAGGNPSKKELAEFAKQHAEYKKNPEKYDKEWMEPAGDR